MGFNILNVYLHRTMFFSVTSGFAYVFAFAGITAAVWIYIYYVKLSGKLRSDVDDFKMQQVKIDDAGNFPVILVDNHGIIAENEKFKNKFKLDITRKISDILPDLDIDMSVQHISMKGSGYLVYIFDNDIEQGIKSVYFLEDNQAHLGYGLHEADNNIMGLIFVDNYDDVMDTVEQSMVPLVVALIDRHIYSYIQDCGGVVKRFESDKYILFFDSKSFHKITEKKFELLDQIRDIAMGNNIPFTLSIGIGLNGKNLNQSMDYSRAAIDLALGRGGDQVVIKNGDNFSFFGGKAKEVGTNTKVRARVKAYVLEELIEECENVIIMGHRNPDLDCIGAGIGVYSIVASSGKKCNIVLNQVTTSISSLYNRLIEEDRYKTDCFVNSSEAAKLVGKSTLLVIVDCHRPSIMEYPELCEMADKIVVFDHHRKNAEFVENPVMTYHEPYASSTCELITEMMQYVKQKIKLSPVEADALLSGITVDTKNFFIKTGAKTFEAASYLRRHGADTVRVRLFMQNDMESYKAKSSAINNTRMYKDNIAITISSAYVENPSLTAAQVADDLLNISGIEASFVLCYDNALQQILISARSMGDLNVQRIMEKIGGGGHQTAAGAQIYSDDIEEAIENLEMYIDEYLEEIGEKL